MKIVLCGSISFTKKFQEVSEMLTRRGIEVEMPYTSKRIIAGELTLEQFEAESKKAGENSARKVKDDVIRKHYNLIKDADAILVVNVERKGMSGYIGGNTFLEIGFAHILNKKIYLLNPIPEVSYSDEIEATQPVVLDGDLSKIPN